MLHVHQGYSTHPKTHPTTREAYFVQVQSLNINASLGRWFAGHDLLAPESSRPDRCVRLPQGYLSPSPEISPLSYPLPFPTPVSLTLVFALMSAPASTSASTTASYPLCAAR